MSTDPFLRAAGLLRGTKLPAFLELKGVKAANAPALVKLSTQQTIGQALRELAAYNILSAPVIEGGSSDYAGLLDVADLLRGLMQSIYPELLEPGFLQSHRRLSIAELQSLGIVYTRQLVGSALHGGDLWFKGDSETTLLEVVLDGFRVRLPPAVHAPHHHLRVHHRVGVFDILPGEETPDGPIPEWRVSDVVSQTDVLRLLVSRLDLLDASFGKPLSELGLVQGAAAVRTVPASEPALAAFAAMHRESLSGLGITAGPGGALLANLSVSDLRGLTADRFGALALPVGAFLMLQRSKGVAWEDAVADTLPAAVKEGDWETALQGLQPLTCSPATSLAEAMRLLVEQRKHRVYVVDGSGQPMGVVTPTDVLRLVTYGVTSVG